MKINPNVLRKKVIDMVMAKKSGHIGGAFSMAELTRMEKNGLWTEWHENGQKSYEATYKNGKLIK